VLRDNRILFQHQGSFVDFSPALSDIHGNTKVFAFEAGDYLYLGSFMPFNHRYFDVSAVNAVAANISIELWNGQLWRSVVDIVDETSIAGVPLAKSGVISWGVDPDHSGWLRDDTEDMDSPGLADAPRIFNLYWLRISFSETLTTTTALNYIGHKFSEDAALEAEYPDLGRATLKNAWKAGKTNWNEQTLLAAEYVIQHLRGPKYQILDPGQIMSWDIFEKASVHRTAMIIFKGFGKDYDELFIAATHAYNSAMDLRQFEIDRTGDGTLDPMEKTRRTEWLTR
jgi:hypothetical protein